jgi:hypothetical protein
METKEQLVNTIKEWVRIDNELRALKAEESKRKKEQKAISVQLMDIMKKNNIDEFDINNGRIQYVKKNVKKPITKKVLMDVLTKYYEGDFMKANELNSFILENREETTKESIVRTIDKD